MQDELDAGSHLEELEELRAELQRAAAQTELLAWQVQQLKQRAATAADEHAAAVQQQLQQGATDAAAAVAVADERHQQQMLALQNRLAEAQQQLQAARSELSTLRQEQVLRRGSLVHQVVQAGYPVETEHAAVQTACWPGCHVGPCAGAAQVPEAEQVIRAPLLPLPINSMRQLPSRASNACKSPACSSGVRCSSPTPLLVEMTAKQLQLELARVRIAPIKTLMGSSWGGGGLQQLGLPALRQASMQLAISSADGTNSRKAAQPEEEGDSCFATPMDQTPTSAGDQSPFRTAPSPAEDAACCQEQQHRRPPVPNLNLQLVRSLSSPELPEPSAWSKQDEASSSLSSLGDPSPLSSSRASTVHAGLDLTMATATCCDQDQALPATLMQSAAAAGIQQVWMPAGSAGSDQFGQR